MLVMKFGGASVKDAPSVRRVAEIIAAHSSQPLLVVVSAMDKTTNALEKLASLAVAVQETEAWAQYEFIRSFHHTILENLLPEPALVDAKAQMAPYLTELERIIKGVLLLQDFPNRFYDRVMSFGELLSSVVLASYLRQQGQPAQWLDARDILITDSRYQHAKVIWKPSQENADRLIKPQLAAGKLIVIQGYIASTNSGYTTTLGREGSDFSAALFSNMLDAERMIIWKDVPAVMTADPRVVPDAREIPALTYEQAVEMTFYGASVIHPKTIKPLHNKQIPLYVKSFLDTSLPGTVIAAEASLPRVDRPECILFKKNQAMLTIQPLDFSFMDEQQMKKALDRVNQAELGVNLIQNTAIKLTLVADYSETRIQELQSLLAEAFSVQAHTGLILKTYLNAPASWQPDHSALLVQYNQGHAHVVIQAE